MMDKIFVDCDGTLISSIDAVCHTYNELYCGNSNFIEADPDKVVSWNMQEVIPLCKDINELFGHPLFFEFVQPLDEWTIETLEKLTAKYTLIGCSIGVPANISRKAKFIAKKFPMIKQSVLLMQDDCKMNKSIVRMGNNSIFLDDVFSNLESSDAGFKICVGKKYAWNSKSNYLRCETWQDIGKTLL